MANDPQHGIGGAPTRATTLPDDPGDRKKYPIASGVLDYFPDALVAIARLSWQGNEQHNPGQPLHWARGKSADEADTMLRHFLQRGSKDKDGIAHTAKMAWRALALLQKEIEQQRADDSLNAAADCSEPVIDDALGPFTAAVLADANAVIGEYIQSSTVFDTATDLDVNDARPAAFDTASPPRRAA